MSNTLLYSYINDIGNRLCEPNIYGSASVMIGAGFSKNARYLGDSHDTPPDWVQLAEKMFDELYPKEAFKSDEDRNKQKIIECSGKNVLTLAEKYEIAFDRLKLNNLIERNIADEMYEPDELHSKLLSLNWNDVFTTNYDTLLERTLNKITKSSNYKVVYSQEDLPGSVRPRIVKLHGSIMHSGNYIITEEDYRKYPVNYAPFVNTVQQSMLESRLCLIGFSGNDPNFLNWVGWLRDNMGENCPQIYLCGIFDSMSSAERKMFENKKISIVDISILSQKESKNRYYEALDRFINLLTEKSKKNEESIIDNKIYDKVNFAADLKSLTTYYKDMIDYTNKIIKEINGFVCLPRNKQNTISEYISRNFNAVIYDENKEEIRLQLLGNLTYILRYVNKPLYDSDANKLLEIIDFYRDIEEKNINSYVNIILYLLVMYRIDANNEMYRKYVEKLNDINTKMDINQKNEFYIEKTKYAISIFDYNKALEYVEKIKNNSNYGTIIKKACLLRQLNERDKALELLKDCYADLAQKKYSVNKKASIIGYINLCARSVLSYGYNLDAFKDDEYYANDYNCRKIVIESRDDIIAQLFNNKNKENIKEFAFNPNSYTMHYTMGYTGEEKKIDASFQYLLLQDLLCLPIYSDHKNTIITAVEIIECTSKSPIWKWSRIASINDDKIINSYFTRERIYNTDIKYVERFFDYILELWNIVSHKKKLNDIDKLLSESTIVDILSRLSIVLDETRISNFIHELYKLNNCMNYEEKVIVNIIERLKYSFNNKILELCLDDIFDKIHYRYHLASYFDGINYIEMDIPNLNIYVKNIINELESNDIEIRDNALAKAILLKKMNKLSGYYDEISNKIWEQLDENGFPKSKLYLPIIWREIPCAKNYNFDESYKKYLLNPNFIKRVNDGVISCGINPIGYIIDYISCFQKITHIIDNDMKINLGPPDLLVIMKYIYEYINNEKSLLNNREYDMFGVAKTAEKCFSEIEILISYIYIYGKVTKSWNSELESKLLKVIELYNSLSIEIKTIEIIRNIDNSNNSFEEFEKLILLGKSDDVSIAFAVLQEIIKIYEMNNKVDEVNGQIIDFINKMPYIEMDIAKNILLQMFYIMKREMFLNDDNQTNVINIFSKCYEIYNKRYENAGKVALDAIYNLSNLMKTYYDWLLLNKRNPNNEFEELKEKFKNNKLNEIRMTWKY